MNSITKLLNCEHKKRTKVEMKNIFGEQITAHKCNNCGVYLLDEMKTKKSRKKLSPDTTY